MDFNQVEREQIDPGFRPAFQPGAAEWLAFLIGAGAILRWGAPSILAPLTGEVGQRLAATPLVDAPAAMAHMLTLGWLTAVVAVVVSLRALAYGVMLLAPMATAVRQGVEAVTMTVMDLYDIVAAEIRSRRG